MNYSEQMRNLWEYQKIDQEIDKRENVLKNSQLRKKLSRSVAYLKEQQVNVSRMEGEAQEIQNKLEIVSRECKKSSDEYESIDSLNYDEMTRDQLTGIRQRSAQWADNMSRREKELVKLTNQLTSQSMQLEEMREKIAKTKKEYPALKAKYDEEAEKINKETAPLKAERDEIGKLIDKSLLQHYQSIKGRHANPVARVVSSQCSGCNMQIAPFVLNKIKSSGSILDCENCGRMLYIDEF